MPAKRPLSKKTATPKRKRGRPSKFTPELAAEICARLSKGEPLAAICRDEHMPDDSNVRVWMEKDDKFSHAIADARARGFDAIAQECLTIADQTEHDDEFTESGGVKPNSEWISRSRLRVETRLKLLAKWDPKRYGDKLDLNATVTGEVSIIIGGDAK
jgi:hypothetical protein